MTGAHEAIQAIVSDPALKSTVNFGLDIGPQNGDIPKKWFSSWNNSRDQSKPCTNNNCLKVKIDAQGADKIFKVVKCKSKRWNGC